MFRQILKNLFATTSTRGRLEYLWVTFALIATASLALMFGLAMGTPIFSYPMFFIALIAATAQWFVAAQRVRDIGWNVPLFIGAMLIAGSLSHFTGVGENTLFVAVGGPGAVVSLILLALLAFVPGKSRRTQTATTATA